MAPLLRALLLRARLSLLDRPLASHSDHDHLLAFFVHPSWTTTLAGSAVDLPPKQLHQIDDGNSTKRKTNRVGSNDWSAFLFIKQSQQQTSNETDCHHDWSCSLGRYLSIALSAPSNACCCLPFTCLSSWLLFSSTVVLRLRLDAIPTCKPSRPRSSCG